MADQDSKQSDKPLQIEKHEGQPEEEQSIAPILEAVEDDTFDEKMVPTHVVRRRRLSRLIRRDSFVQGRTSMGVFTSGGDAQGTALGGGGGAPVWGYYALWEPTKVHHQVRGGTPVWGCSPLWAPFKVHHQVREGIPVWGCSPLWAPPKVHHQVRVGHQYGGVHLCGCHPRYSIR